MRLAHRIVAPLAMLLTSAVVGCGESTTELGEVQLWVVEVSGEEFRVRVSDVSARAGFEDRLASGQRGVVIGTLVRGDGGFNMPWDWHLDPATVEAVDAAIELCDGRPSMVQADLDYWIDTVRTFCPWGARIAREEWTPLR